MSNPVKKLLVKRQQEEEATAYAFQEFLETFQNSTPISKTFIQSGVYNPGSKASGSQNDTQGKVYAPVPIYKVGENVYEKAIEYARLIKVDRVGNPATAHKAKSHLQELKEELEQKHFQVEKTLQKLSPYPATTSITNVVPFHNKKQKDMEEERIENTTNLFLSNIKSTLNEQDLMQIFGVYGPLASVKIMWPRFVDRSRPHHVGFVAYMSRHDCKRAFNELGTRTDMKIAWGKPVDIPSQPVYIPPEMVRMMLPPPYSGLPFNAQLINLKRNKPFAKQEASKVDLSKTFVKVTIPMDKKILFTIHRTIEFVIREGPMIEALIMQREFHNPIYQFLIDNKSSMHIYYRWKLYSLLHGESITSWSTKPFRMFKGGSIWMPPVVPDYTKGMNVKDPSIKFAKEAKHLAHSDQLLLIRIVRKLTPEKSQIAAAMIFCLEKMSAAPDVVSILFESFEAGDGPDDEARSSRGLKQIARLYLISDILYNAKQRKCVEFVSSLKDKVLGIFKQLKSTLEYYHTHKEYRFADVMRLKIMKVIRAWEMWRILPHDLLVQLEETTQPNANILFSKPVEITVPKAADLPVEFPQEEVKRNAFSTINSSNEQIYSKVAIVKSKWETQSPEVLQSQAMSTARMQELELERKYEEELIKQKEQVKARESLEYDDLRRIEMKVIRYQDSLEGRKRKLKYGKTIANEVDEYREKCIKKLKLKRMQKDLIAAFKGKDD